MAVVASDTFNRADSATLGTSSSGHAWVLSAGAQSWGVVSNRASIMGTPDPGDPRTAACINSFASDGAVQASIVNAATGAASVGLLIRATADLEDGLLVGRYLDTLAVRRKEGGAPGSVVGSTTDHVPGAGDLLRVEFSGSRIDVYVNGTLGLSVTTSFNATETYHGLDDYGGDFDDFQVEDTDPPPGSGSATAFDTFDRADNTTLGTADSGHVWGQFPWPEGSHSWDIVSNEAQLTNSGGGTFSLAYVDVGVSDGEVSVTLTSLAGDGSGVVGRVSSVANNIRLEFHNSSGELRLWEIGGGGVDTLLDSLSVAVTTGDVLALEMSGTSLVGKVNGITRVSGTSSHNLTETRHGLWAYSLNLATFNDFNFFAGSFAFAGGVRGGHAVFNAAAVGVGGTHRRGYDAYAAAVAGYSSALQAFAGAAGGGHAVLNSFTAAASGYHRVGYLPYEAGARGTATTVNAYATAAAGVHRIAYDPYAGGAGGSHTLYNAFASGARGTHAYFIAVSGSLSGGHRVANDALARFELYHGVDAPPDFGGAPAATTPADYSTTPPTMVAPIVRSLTPGHTHRLVIRLRNAWGLLSRNTIETVMEIDGAGNPVATPPRAPSFVAVEAAAAGTVLVRAHYPYAADGANQADAWLVYLRSDGTDPDPSIDTPTEIPMSKLDGLAKLAFTSSAFAEGTTVKVIVRTRRSGTPDVDSTNTDVHTAVATLLGPARVDPGNAFYGRTLEQAQ